MSLAPSPSVVRAGDLLRHLVDHPSRHFTVSQLSRAVGIPRATCNSLLLGLTEVGLVRRDATQGYGLGVACIALGDAARAANPALRVSSLHADALARAHSVVTAVSMRDGDETRVAGVFDCGPPFGIRPRAGDAIRLVPPFGASFVAWDDDALIDRWLHRAEPPLTPAERERYRAALAAVRTRRYSITVASDPQARLAATLEQLAVDPEAEDVVRSRDAIVREIAHTDYLATELDPRTPTRIIQISAPVFDAGGRVAVSIMLLGSGSDTTAAQTASIGELVRSAAARATTELGGAWVGDRA